LFSLLFDLVVAGLLPIAELLSVVVVGFGAFYMLQHMARDKHGKSIKRFIQIVVAILALAVIPSAIARALNTVGLHVIVSCGAGLPSFMATFLTDFQRLSHTIFNAMPGFAFAGVLAVFLWRVAAHFWEGKELEHTMASAIHGGMIVALFSTPTAFFQIAGYLAASLSLESRSCF
jgi:hypothetical protein